MVLIYGSRVSPRLFPHKPKPGSAQPWQLLSLLSQLCSAFTVEQATYNHVKIHHGYTNVIGLGDSSTWKLPFLNRYVYMFIAPLAVPILTPLVALGTCPTCLGTGCWVWEARDCPGLTPPKGSALFGGITLTTPVPGGTLQEGQEMLHLLWGPHLLHLLFADAEKTLHIFLSWLLKSLAIAIINLQHPKSIPP